MPFAASHRFAMLVALALLPQLASAYDVNIAARDPRAVYLRVGDGVMINGPYSRTPSIFNPTFPTPGVGGNVPLVRATVPANQVGNNTSILMTTPGNPRTTSDWDNFQFCNSGQVYVGGFYRATNASTGNTARLTYSAPAFLTNENNQTIPISQISWTTSGNGDVGAQPFGAGTFSAGSTQLTTISRNQWRETCMTFRYANQNLVASGTYTATVTFTLSQP
ncbi:hypothetical protein [Arenimonas caeni]|uniref:DUF4402 domain-containing protein n=1 Tax=Arenimonas caeni TaxID=2058085 RepID=A0A2P6MCJ0_9GAMM|nr:hypothetical protein [Arenimonas caeni]PRH83702.1 hypothetical protein C6N40_00730 [Arenimonas caeni]